MTVIELVERERRRLRGLIAAAGTAAALAIVALVLAGGVALLGGARWIRLSPAAPFLVWLGVLVVLGAGIWWTRRRLSRDATRAGLALAVEREQSLRAGSLRGALEVAESGALGRRGAEQLASRLGTTARARVLAPALRRQALRRAAVATAAVAAAFLVLVSRSSAAPDGWRAMAHPVRAWRGTLLAPITLTRLPSSVLRGERVQLVISAPGRREITLSQRAKGAAWRHSRLSVHGDAARLTLGPIDADLTLLAGDGRSSSDTAVLRVVERPFIGDVSVRALFPAYLERREETLPLGEPARLPRGTVLVIEGQSSTELRGVSLARGADTVRFAASGRRFSGRFPIAESGRYLWSAAGMAGDIADVPTPLELEVVPDSAPRIEILSPSRDTTVSGAETVVISMLATDDHGLESVALRTWTKKANGVETDDVVQPLLAQRTTQWDGDAQLDLAKAALEPGDELHVSAVASDASPWRQRGASRELVLRLPGLREQRESIRAASDSAVERAAAAAAAQKALQQRTSEAARARQRSGEQKSGTSGGSSKSGSNPLSYESAEQAKALAKEQRALAERMQQLQEAAKNLERQLKQAGALDSGLASRLQEAQKLLRDALTPELAEQLQKLESAAQNLSNEDARKALGDLASQQQKLREQLEKSLEMLKRAAIEGSMETLKDEAKDLAKEERELADSMDKSRDAAAKPEARQDARELAERSQDLAQDIAELQKRLEQQKAEAGAQRVNEARENVKESAQQMERASRGDRAPETPREKPAARQKPQGAEESGQQDGKPRAPKAEDGKPQDGKPQDGKPQDGKPRSGQQQSGQQQGQQQSGQQQQGQRGEPRSGEQQNGDEAREAAEAMEKAADQLAEAREQQIGEWKKELTSELDQSIQEMLQLSREQGALEQKAREGAEKNELSAEQGALQQGVEKAGQRLQQAGRKSSLLSNRSQRAVGDAQRKVEQATKQVSQSTTSAQAASSMKEASEALNQAAASLVRDRERAQNAQSASGFSEMLQQMQEMAKQQGSLNAQSAELIPRPGSDMSQQGKNAARELAKQQRQLAEGLDEVGDSDNTGKADEMAKEARQIAAALESAALDQSVVDRQQRLFRKMLDAGRTLEQDKRDETGKREAKAATGDELFAPAGSASGKAASRFEAPTWNDLRGLTPEERRLVLDYFKRINAERP